MKLYTECMISIGMSYYLISLSVCNNICFLYAGTS